MDDRYKWKKIYILKHNMIWLLTVLSLTFPPPSRSQSRYPSLETFYALPTLSLFCQFEKKVKNKKIPFFPPAG